VFPVRYELNSYILFRRHSVFKGLIGIQTLLYWAVILFVRIHTRKRIHMIISLGTARSVYRRARRPRSWGSIPGRGKRLFSPPQRPDRLCSPLSLLSNGYRGLFSWGQSGRAVKLTTQLNPMAKSRMVELCLHFHIRLHGVLRN
jgi:hypothetical protein